MILGFLHQDFFSIAYSAGLKAELFETPSIYHDKLYIMVSYEEDISGLKIWKKIIQVIFKKEHKIYHGLMAQFRILKNIFLTTTFIIIHSLPQRQ